LRFTAGDLKQGCHEVPQPHPAVARTPGHEPGRIGASCRHNAAASVPYEKGEHELTVDWMRRFSKALGVPPMELISNAAMAGLIDDVEPLSGGQYSAVVAITAAKGTHPPTR
jgi:hypothetical protein